MIFCAYEFASVCLLFWYQPLHSWGWAAIQGSLFWSFTRWTISTCPSWPGLQKVFKSTLHPIVSTVSLPKLFLYLYSCRQAIRAYMRQYWPLVNLRPWLPLAIKLSIKSAVTAEIQKKEFMSRTSVHPSLWHPCSWTRCIHPREIWAQQADV